MSRMRRTVVRAMAVVTLLLLAGVGVQYWRDRQVREALYAALAPVRITNCELQRFGSKHDGGYLMCGNLVKTAEAAYSYGIDGHDVWGCDLAGPLNLPLHQYDCFNTDAPRCFGNAIPQFHAECVGPTGGIFEERRFDTMASQIEDNGDAGKRLIVKMDVEGSEWESLRTAPDHVLDAIDQLAIEFHGIEDPRHLETAARLSRFFYVAHYHHNNFECRPGHEPFAGPVFELLLVNKRIAQADPSLSARGASPLDAPNSPAFDDCQAEPERSEPARIARWLHRKVLGALWRLAGG